MTTSTLLKLGQIAGVLLLAAGVASYIMNKTIPTYWFLSGAMLYGGCRLAAWLRSK